MVEVGANGFAFKWNIEQTIKISPRGILIHVLLKKIINNLLCCFIAGIKDQLQRRTNYDSQKNGDRLENSLIRTCDFETLCMIFISNFNSI